MPLAINPETGEALYLKDGAWEKAPIAKNDKGESLAFDGEGWAALGNTPQPSVATDMLKSGGVGLAEGVIGLAGTPGDIGSINSSIADAIGVPEWAQTLGKRALGAIPGGAALTMLPGSQQIKEGIESVTGEFYEPQTTAGEYAQTVGQFAPAAAMGPGSFAKRAVTQTLIPALTSETAGQLTEGTAAEPYARVGGAVAGGLAAQGGAKLLQKAITPHPSTPDRQAAVDVLKSHGIKPTAGQATGDMGLMRKEAQRGGAKYSSMIEAQNKQLTAAALGKVGVKADKATPQVVNQFLDDIGNQFDDLAAQSKATITRNHGIKAMQIVDDYKNGVEGQAAPIVEKVAKTFQTMGQKQITGENYKKLRSEIDRAQRGASSSNLKEALTDLRNLLDDAVESGINPDIKGAWKEVRRNYRNWLSLEKAIDPTTGMVTPASLQRSAITVGGKRSYLRGKSDFTELGNAADMVLVKPNSSGSVENLMSIIPRTGATSGIGATIGGMVGGPVGAGIGAAAGAAYPMAAGRAMMTGPMQQYLGNQAMSPVPWLQNPGVLPFYPPLALSGK